MMLMTGISVAAGASCRTQQNKKPISDGPPISWPAAGTNLPYPPVLCPTALYVSDTTGETRALNTRTGAVIWTARPPDGPGLPPVAWQGPPVPADDLLVVGNGRGRPSFDGPNPSQVVAFHAVSGRVAWAFPVDDYAGTVLHAGGVIVCQTNSSLYGIEARSGRRMWQWSPGSLSTVQLTRDRLLVERDAPAGMHLVAVEPRNGHRQWTAEFPRTRLSWIRDSAGMLAIGSYPTPTGRSHELAVLSERTGKRIWSRKLDHLSLNAVLSRDVLTTSDRTRVRALHLPTGAEAWSFPLPEPAVEPSIAISGDLTFLGMPVRRQDGLFPLQAVHRGTKRWSIGLPGEVGTMTRGPEGVIYCTSTPSGTDFAIAVDTRTGDRIWSTPIEDAAFLLAGDGLLYACGGRIVALSAATGATITTGSS